MAAVRLIAMHIGRGKTLAQCLKERTDYAQNPEKTEKGNLVTGYECDPETCDEEFLLSKRQYRQFTGREQGHEVIAYQIRQSFKPGELTPGEANQIGHELAMAFTKGRHAFIVATHTDRPHLHNHIIFNSTSLDCKRKFRDFHRSNIALQRISDRICLEHGLSVIEAGPREKWSKRKEFPKRASFRDKVRGDIDRILSENPGGLDFEGFLGRMEGAGYEVSRGKHTAVRAAGQKRFIRFRSLGNGYTEADIRDRISGKLTMPEGKEGKNWKKGRKPGRVPGGQTGKADVNPEEQSGNVEGGMNWRESGHNGVSDWKPVRSDENVGRKASKPGGAHFNLLIDIQERIRQGKGAGFARWAKVYNLKQMSETLLFMREKDITSFENLYEKTDRALARFNGLNERIKEAESRMSENLALQKRIQDYARTKGVYLAYRKNGYSKKFLEEHRAEIALHKAAKDAFNASGLKKIPSIRELREEYARLLAKKREAYKGYREAGKEMRAFLKARHNVEAFYGKGRQERVGERRKTKDGI